MSGLEMQTMARKYELEVMIAAPREVVWKAIAEEIDLWWLPDFRMVGEGSVVSFDTRAGGHLIESREDGGSLLWYTVQMCTPGESLYLVGFLAPDFGGPATTMLRLALEEEKGGATRLRVSDAVVGCVSEGTAASLQSGWTQLFSDGLKVFVEKAR